MSAHDFDLGLEHDLRSLLRRREALVWLATAGSAVGLIGCSGGEATASEATAPNGACLVPPPETAGPFPADGSNRAGGSPANVLTQSGVIRSDIRSSFGGLSGNAAGAAVTLTVAVVNANHACEPLVGYAVYLWHCDAAGAYSIYELPTQNYLRGVAVTDANGRAAFTTIIPGCYPGRYPHMHFEVYRSVAEATNFAKRLLVSQLALPEDICAAVYRDVAAYSPSRAAFARTSLRSDGIFRDNSPAEIAAQTLAMAGSPLTGYAARVTVGLAA